MAPLPFLPGKHVKAKGRGEGGEWGVFSRRLSLTDYVLCRKSPFFTPSPLRFSVTLALFPSFTPRTSLKSPRSRVGGDRWPWRDQGRRISLFSSLA